jgi:hypothetical protein
MLLASFTEGLSGTPGRQVRFSLLKNMDEALKIALTVNEAELQVRRNETFYVDEARERSTADRPSRGTRCKGTVRNTTQHAGAGRAHNRFVRDLLEIRETQTTADVMLGKGTRIQEGKESPLEIELDCQNNRNG